MRWEMDARPSGDNLCSLDVEEWPEMEACSTEKCPGRENSMYDMLEVLEGHSPKVQSHHTFMRAWVVCIQCSVQANSVKNATYDSDCESVKILQLWRQPSETSMHRIVLGQKLDLRDHQDNPITSVS
ncbi:hypothetical protein EDD85DRAFT_942351 [Armillaria nabsnona]|nr:hypothetical protein EDD85DRAFT_942351 [Armillaria nabsnona]